jgi:hypothetical protein
VAALSKAAWILGAVAIIDDTMIASSRFDV